VGSCLPDGSPGALAEESGRLIRGLRALLGFRDSSPVSRLLAVAGSAALRRVVVSGVGSGFRVASPGAS
jgi:hypothetical protein